MKTDPSLSGLSLDMVGISNAAAIARLRWRYSRASHQEYLFHKKKTQLQDELNKRIKYELQKKTRARIRWQIANRLSVAISAAAIGAIVGGTGGAALLAAGAAGGAATAFRPTGDEPKMTKKF